MEIGRKGKVLEAIGSRMLHIEVITAKSEKEHGPRQLPNAIVYTVTDDAATAAGRGIGGSSRALFDLARSQPGSRYFVLCLIGSGGCIIPQFISWPV